MQTLPGFFHDPIYLFVVFWIVSALADSMPQPTAASEHRPSTWFKLPPGA